MPAIKVLIVDDSPTVGKLVSEWLAKDPQLTVIGQATDPYVARDKIVSLKPDVLILDMEMPRMDGLTFLKILMAQNPLPVIIMSSLTQRGSALTLEALEIGAFDVLTKPSPTEVGPFAALLINRIKAAIGSNRKKKNPDAIAIESASNYTFHPQQILLLGASTGGTEALKAVLTALPSHVPGICIVQHIPPVFSKAFADRLNTLCEFEVREAKHGDRLTPGLCLLAPGDYHMVLNYSNATYTVHLNQGPKIWHQRPAVDVLFSSAATCTGNHAVAAILTGMGCDGAEGLLKLRQCGAKTFAQDENSCVVFGMPKAAFTNGAAQKLVPLNQMAHVLYKSLITHIT